MRTTAALLGTLILVSPLSAQEAADDTTSAAVQARIDSLNRVRTSLHKKITTIETELDSLKALKQTAAEDSLKFNTYDWDHKPYADFLKRHIEVDIFSLPEFKELELSEGKIRLRFKILKDGKLRELQALDEGGNPLQQDTGVQSWSMSMKGRPLPDDFPEEYLRVTGTFEYTVVEPEPEEEKEPEIVTINDGVGDEIDLEERNRYGLFQDVEGFHTVSYYKQPDGNYTIQLVTLDKDGNEVTEENPIIYAGIEFVRSRVKAQAN